MKHIILYITLILSFTLFIVAEEINECKTDIYFGNGVWNTTEDAEYSRYQLEKYIINREIIKGDPLLKAKYGEVKLAYNLGQGTLLDVLETYYQLRESGQLAGIGFFTAIAALTVEIPGITLGAIATQKLMEPFTKDWEQGNVDEMWQKYYNESFKLGHKVLLVSHSQGNLFANRVHDKITPSDFKDYFANFQVASPASEVKATKGGYVTLYGDPIINPIPGSMGGNANGSPGHAFVEAYLAQSDPYNKIVTGIKQLLPILDSELSQWQTDQESDKDTCDYRITVKHRFDPSIEIGEKVYPFNAAKKLYHVNGEYVKASCGGKNILSTWDGKKDTECLMIDNVEKEKIRKDIELPILIRVGYYFSTSIITSWPSEVYDHTNNKWVYSLAIFSQGGGSRGNVYYAGGTFFYDKNYQGYFSGTESDTYNVPAISVVGDNKDAVRTKFIGEVNKWWGSLQSMLKSRVDTAANNANKMIINRYGLDNYERIIYLNGVDDGTCNFSDYLILNCGYRMNFEYKLKK